MRRYAGTVGRAVFGVAAVPGGREVSAGVPGGAAAHLYNDMLTVL